MRQLDLLEPGREYLQMACFNCGRRQTMYIWGDQSQYFACQVCRCFGFRFTAAGVDRLQIRN
jgi:ribosomal protein S27E